MNIVRIALLQTHNLCRNLNPEVDYYRGEKNNTTVYLLRLKSAARLVNGMSSCAAIFHSYLPHSRKAHRYCCASHFIGKTKQQHVQKTNNKNPSIRFAVIPSGKSLHTGEDRDQLRCSDIVFK